jgi:type VI secretion system protein ImpH
MSTDVANSLVDAAQAAPETLLDRLRRRAWEFDFFQAVWLLERYGGAGVPVGERGPQARERLRFRPDVSLSFPATDVARLHTFRDPLTDEERLLLEVHFLGLYGVSTPLPLHYAVSVVRATEAVGTEEAGGAPPDEGVLVPGSHPVRDFLDLFHNRLIALFYRSWLKYRYERAFPLQQRDVITGYLLWLIGCAPEWTEATLGVPPVRLLRYAGTLTQHPRSATTLAGLLWDWWGGIPVRVEQFVGQWVPLDPADLNRIGLRNSRLGVDLTVGDQVYDLAGAFQIAIGPVDWDTYVTFVPGGSRFQQTCDLARLYCCDPLAFNLHVTLEPGQVPPLPLVSDARAGALGLTTWLCSGDVGEVSVSFSTAATRALPPAASATPPAAQRSGGAGRSEDRALSTGRGAARLRPDG